ncbi:MAG: pyridoxal phosphate-dependent aminotransferase [Candidatus Hermodarchaeota archaeon]
MDFQTILSKSALNAPFSGIRKVLEWESKVPADQWLHLNIGQPDFSCPSHITQAVCEAVKEGYTSYTAVYGLPELRQAIADSTKAEQKGSYDPNTQIFVTNGAQAGIYACLRALLDPGDEVVVPDPCYPPYLTTIELCGGRTIPISTFKEEGRFDISPSDLRQVLDRHSKVKALLLISPSNPTGSMYHETTLKAISDLILEQDNIIVISDEIYSRIIFEEAKTITQVSEEIRDRTFIVGSFSKTYSMTGFRLGYLMGPAEVLSTIKTIHHTMNICAPAMSQKAGVAALTGSQDEVERMVQEYKKRRDYLVRSLCEIRGIECNKPQGAFYVFPKVIDTGMDGLTFSKKLKYERGVVTVPGEAFSDPSWQSSSKEYIRISYAASQATLEKSLEEISAFIGK